jgi:peptidoglycan/xylan/chitin deacetylase (PgdA/CDA1 family)
MPVIPVLRSVARAARLDLLARVANRKRLLIITYHGIREDASPARSWLLLPLSEFERQIEFLRTHYDVLPIDEAIATPDSDRPRACITFDDGYRNNLELALPVLERFGLPATIFLPTALIGSNDLLWTTRLDFALRHATDAACSLFAKWVGIEVRSERGVSLSHRVSNALKTFAPAKRDEVLMRIFSQVREPPSDEMASHAFLTWDDVATMEATGLVTFGAHTVHHEIVRNLDDVTVRRELADSIAEVGKRCARPSRVFAYPNGRDVDFDERAERLLPELGCIAAVSTIEGLNDASTPRFALRRISVGSEMRFTEFRSHASGLDSQARRLVGETVRGG